PTQVELSTIWLELLGQQTQASVGEENIPMLESDPWSHLLHEQGATVLDLQHGSLHMSDLEVEQLLQQLQERREQ
ncbi:MAG TPA: hypothetical protein DHW02_09295, partial [Ktedonobacter sp.]|nr:hypothetical protein [Ktedonobacter sp.]